MAWTAPRTWVTDEMVTSSIMNTHVRDNLNAVLPIGSFIARAAAYTTTETAVEGRWLQCNGVAVSRTTYSALFSYLNGLSPTLPFGSSDGVTTYNLPDLRGRTLYAEGENADVDVMGDNDLATIANRSPSHHHRESARDGAIGSGPYAQGNNTLVTGLEKTSGNANLQDTPAYLVAGSYFIKYTS